MKNGKIVLLYTGTHHRTSTTAYLIYNNISVFSVMVGKLKNTEN